MVAATVLLSLATAATWALTTQFQRKGLASVDGRTGALVVVASFATFFWLIAPFVIEWEWFATRAALIFFLSGLLAPGIAQQFQMLSVERLGPTFTAAVGAFAPAFAIVPAIFFLDESLNLQGFLGISLMIAGIVFSVRAKAKGTGTFALALIWLAIAAAGFRGIAQPVVKLGLTELPEPFFATLVMVTAALVFIGGSHLLRPRETVRFEVGANLLWLVCAGVILSVGFLLLSVAYTIGDVVVAAPFIATMPMWVVLFDHFIFKHDKIGKEHVVATIIVTVGAIVLITR
jgi:drug/metabolite transporter (DMT)-like permease